MKAKAITLTPNGRLTEHTAHVDVRGDVPQLSYRNGSGRVISFTPMRLVMSWQWSWAHGGWHVLEIKVLGQNGAQDIKVSFRNPDSAPDWVRDAVKLATPALTLPTNEAGESTV